MISQIYQLKLEKYKETRELTYSIKDYQEHVFPVYKNSA